MKSILKHLYIVAALACCFSFASCSQSAKPQGEDSMSSKNEGGMEKSSMEKSDMEKSDLTVHKFWIRAVPPVSKTSAAYMVLMNKGDKPDFLISGESSIAEALELHTVVMQGETMSMQPVEKIEIPANGSTELKTGGYHVMFLGLKKVPKVGENVILTLTFQNAGKITLELPVHKTSKGMADMH